MSYFHAVDGGEVYIATAPSITSDEAVEIALAALAEDSPRLQLDETVLAVSIYDGVQLLVWEVYFEVSGELGGPIDFFCVIINAQTGEVMGELM